MATLKIFADDITNSQAACLEEHTDADVIAGKLLQAGVAFERWEADQTLAPDAGQEDIIHAYRESVDRLMTRHGFQSVDVVSLQPDHPDREALRKKFLDEHTHSEYEVRFFVDGKGLFYIHHEDRVYCVMCGKGDLISVPANTRHWFDMGATPDFKCIRLFTSADGWAANLTGDDIARRFPGFEQFV